MPRASIRLPNLRDGTYMDLILIGVGGALGTVGRFAISEWLTPEDAALPWGTFAVNVSGALLLGLLVAFLDGAADGRQLRLLFAVGFLGAFTTFSTFSLEIVRLAQSSGWSRGAAYAGATLALGVAAVALGLWLGHALRTG